jgi:hypothetical protein
VKSGAATYHDLGYTLPGGQVPRTKLLEFLAVDEEVSNAIERKNERANQ